MNNYPTVESAVGDAQYELPYAITVLPTAVPHAALEQSRTPYQKLTLLQRHFGSGESHPKAENCPIILVIHVWPQKGREAIPVTVEIPACVALAAAQYALPYAMTVLATAVPQAPFEQSRMP